MQKPSRATPGPLAEGGEVRLETDVQPAVGAFAQSAFHAGVVGAGGTGVVEGVGCADQAELDALGVRGVELGKLDHSVRR